MDANRDGAMTTGNSADDRTQFQAIVSIIPGIVYHGEFDSNRTVLSIDGDVVALTGYPAADFIANRVRSLASIVHPDDRDETLRRIQTAIDANAPWYVEYRVLHSDGSTRWVSERGRAMRNTRDNRVVVDGLILDITAQKQTEQELLTAQELLEQAGQIARVGAWELDVLDGAIRWSRVTYEIHETPPDFKPILADGINFYKEGENRRRIAAVVERAIATGEPFDEELQIITAKGNERWVRALGKAEFRNGRWVRLYGTFQDIHAQKLAEMERRESDERFRQIAEHVEEVFWLSNAANNHILYVTPAYERVWGRSCQSLYDNPQSFVEALHPDDRADIRAALKQYVHTGVFDRECRIVRPDGAVRWVHARSTPITDASGAVVAHAGAAIDITDRKEMEDELRLQTRLQEMLMQISATYISLPLERVDAAIEASLGDLGRFVAADRVYIFDYDFEQQVCNNTHEWCEEGITPQIEELQGVPLSMIPDWVATHVRGETMYVPDVFALPEESGLRQTLEPQEIKSLITVPMMDGERCLGFVGFDSVRHHYYYSEAERRLLTIFAQMLVNIRKRREIEDALQKATLEAQAANRAKSEFLANMSHEIRTPLNGVIGFTELLLKTPLDAVQQQYANHVSGSAQTLLGIINDILDLSKIEAGRLELEQIETDIVELLEQTADIVKYQAAEKGLELLLNISPTMPRLAVVDPVRLKQILINLLSNAVKFTEQGEVEVKVEFTPRDEQRGRYAFSVRDTGIGISEAQKKRLFRAFSQGDTSTTRKFGGTGLGLVISNLLAEKMGGKIEVHSVLGKGSVLHFVVETACAHSPQPEAAAPLSIKRVLVVDDNDNNRLILERYLAHWGVEYSGCDSGATALAVLAVSPPFDALLIDYHMPGIDGLETVRLLRETNASASVSAMSVILMHNTADNQALRDQCQQLGIRFALNKPIKIRELQRLLQDLNSAGWSSAAPAPPPAATEDLSVDTRPVTILVAEDVATNMMLIRILLKKMIPNVEVIEAHNGLEAVQAMQERKIDLVLMDVQMPEMDGLTATQRIRTIEKSTNSHTPIIALTAGAFREERERCLASGMDDFITKPVQVAALVEMTKRYLPETL